MSGRERAEALVVCGGGGLLLGLLLGLVWRFVERFEWLPFYGPVSELMSVGGGVGIALRLGLLTAAGLGLGVYSILTTPRFEISDDELVIHMLRDVRRIRRDKIAGMFRKGSKLIIDSAEGRHLFEADADIAKDRMRQAFLKHGYPYES